MIAVLAFPGTVSAAPPGSTVIRLTKAQEKTLNIQTVRLKKASIRPWMTLYGELRDDPDGIWILSSPLAGAVANMPGKTWPQLGTAVTRGTSLARIKPVVSTTLQITLALELTKMKADLVAARVAQAASAAAYGREKSLYAQNKAVSLQRVQTAQAAVAAARARVRADVQSITAISQQLKTKTGGFLPLPIFQSGMITDILTHPGEAVAADQALLKIEDFHTLVAAVALPASDSGNVAMGTVIRVRALGHRHWLRAKPLALAPQADRQTRGLSVLYVIDNPGSLRPGMAITAMVPKTGKTVTRIIIPRTAVVWWRGERWVYLQHSNGVFVLHELVHPTAFPGGFTVRDGTLPAQRLVSNGAQLLMTIQLQSVLKPSV
ncbi:MAG: efflux RND transporter periplasmic adaptor subunit [Phycisphaerae bacterium]